MTSNGYQDLASILKSLTSYGPIASQPSAESSFTLGSAVQLNDQPSPALQPWDENSIPVSNRSYGYQPSVSELTTSPHQYSISSLTAPSHSQFQHPTSGSVEVLTPTLTPTQVHAPSDLQLRSITPMAKPDMTPHIDPRTIIEWSVGLRYVTKLAAQNEQIVDSVKKVIHVEQVLQGVAEVESDDQSSTRSRATMVIIIISYTCLGFLPWDFVND